MAVFDTDLDYTKLIQFTNGTLQLASFVQIRNALIKRFKDIYGNDIDVSPASGDGQYINSIALLINNIFQTIKQGYDSLDPAVATGQYLDTLCSYNHITRIMPTASTAQLWIYNSTDSDIVINDSLTFIDKNNQEWIYDTGGKPITIPAGTGANPFLLTNVTCSVLGNILAPGTNCYYHKVNNDWVETQNVEEQDWSDPQLYSNERNGTIYQTVGQNGLWVWQYSDAVVGEIMETDEALRSRRYQMLGNSSVTILEGLKGSLLNLTGIKDVYIFNNTGSTTVHLTGSTYEPVADNTDIISHSIYVVLRYKEGVEIADETIGRIIYNKLTPGIATNAPYDSSTEKSIEIVRTDNFSDYVYWKKCSFNHPQITITFHCSSTGYDFPVENNAIITASHVATSEVEKNIVKRLQAYISDVKINDYLSIANLMSIMQQSDIQKSGMSTFFTKTGNIINEDLYPANLSYFKYNDSDYKFSYNNTDPLNVTGTLVIEGQNQ